MKRKDYKSEIYKSVKSKRKAIRNVGPSYSLGSYKNVNVWFDVPCGFDVPLLYCPAKNTIGGTNGQRLVNEQIVNGATADIIYIKFQCNS
jgi:hypothetical protein